MERSQKEALVAEFGDIFAAAQSGVLVDFQGLTVEQLTSLRKSLFAKNGSFRVLKNRLAKIAAKDTPFESLADEFVQNRALVYSETDPVGTAKVMTDQAKSNEKLKIIAGLLVTEGQGEKLDLAAIKELSDLPTRDELIAKLLYLLNAPITNFVRTLNEVPASFVRTIQAVADSKQ